MPEDAGPSQQSPPGRNVLLVVPCSLRVGGGQELDVLRLAARLARRSFRVRVVDFQAFLREEPRLTDANVTEKLAGTTRVTLGAIPLIRKLTALPTIRAARRLKAEIAGADVVIHCPYYLEDLAVTLLARLNHRPLIASQENTFLHRVPGNPREALQDLWNRVVGVRLLRSIAGVRTLGSDEQETLRSFGVDRSLVLYVPPWSGDLPGRMPSPADRPLPTPSGAPESAAELRVLISGRMTPQKGTATIVEILERCGHRPELLARLRFLFVGTRQLPFEIDRFIREFPDRAQNLGFFPGGLAEVFARTDVLLMPSLYESLGFTAVEAIGNGVPVIASDVSGLREVVRPGETGWLAPPRDPEAFVRLLEACLTQKVSDPSGWNELRARCRASFQLRFGPEVLEGQFEQFVTWLDSEGSKAGSPAERGSPANQ